MTGCSVPEKCHSGEAEIENLHHFDKDYAEN